MKLKNINQLVKASFISTLVSTSAYAEPTLELSGLVEMSIAKAESDNKTQAAVDTVELAITAAMNDSISAEIVLLQEDMNTDDQTDFEVDTAFIHMETGLGTVSAGKFTVPFTTGETNMIEDPTTLIEPAGVGLVLSGAAGFVEYSLYTIDPAKDDTADITGNAYADQGELGFGDVAGMNVNVPFNDDIALNASYAKIDDKTGASAALVASMGGFGVILEGTSIEGEDENRTNIEVSYDLGMGTLAASVQKDGEGNEFRSLGFSTDIYENTALNFQYMNDDSANENAMSAMLAYQF